MLWAHQITWFFFHTFSECMGIYGGGRRIITELGANEMPYGLALRHSNVYWTDWKKYVVLVLLLRKINYDKFCQIRPKDIFL